MKVYMTIDTGTTNTRIRILDPGGRTLDTFRSGVGVKNTAVDGNNDRLKFAVAEGIRTLCRRHGIGQGDIIRILASGMITSDVGIYELPHLTAPAGFADFRNGARDVLLPEIADIPITFIPGLKNDTSGIGFGNFEQMDIMRGEEVEAIALLEDLPEDDEYLLVLPGSHTKFVRVAEGKRLTGCLTALSGELLEVISTHTLISGSVEKQFVSAYKKEMVLTGYRTASRVGLSRAAFSTRILGQFVTKDANTLANYLLGAVLAEDVRAILHTEAMKVSPETRVVVAGKAPLKEALIDVFTECGRFREVSGARIRDEENLSARGAWLLFAEPHPAPSRT